MANFALDIRDKNCHNNHEIFLCKFKKIKISPIIFISR